MGNSYAGQLKTTRFEEVLHSSIEASLRSNNVIPRPVFTQLYLEAEKSPSQEAGKAEKGEEEEEEGAESNSPPPPYHMKPAPEGRCATDGFCQSGKDLRLAFIASDLLEVPPGFLLVGARSPTLPDHILVCSVDRTFLPDERGRNALLGFSGNCVGCGEKGFRYFTEFCNHINLKLTTQPKKQKHLQYYLYRNAQGMLVRGPLICWRGDSRSKPSASSPGVGHLSSDPPLPLEPTSATGQYTGISTDSLASSYAQGASPASMTNGRDHPMPQQPSHQSGLMSQGLCRPSITGTITNTGPPKKRHKSWSSEPALTTEPSNKTTSSAAVNDTKTDFETQTCVSQCSSFLPQGVSVTVPDHLLHTCRLQPVIFKGHGSLPPLCGNVGEVRVSSLLQSCYKSYQALPRVYEQYRASPIQPLSTEMQILLTVYYLVQLGSDQVPLIDDLEQIFVRSWREANLPEIRQCQQPLPPGPTQPVSPTQLPWLAKLATSSSGDSVLILDAPVSLAEGLNETFRSLMEGKLARTNYVVIICTFKGGNTESCVVVTGRCQARALAESMLTPGDCANEISYELAAGKTGELGALLRSLGPDGDMDALLEKFRSEKNVRLPLSSSLEPSQENTKATCSEFLTAWHDIRPVQLAVARKLLSHVCAIADSSTQNLDLGSFDKVEFRIFTPPSEATFQQIVLHLWNSGILRELCLDKECLSQKEAEQFVVKLDPNAQGKINEFIQSSKRNPYTLFILVHDHAHWDINRSTRAFHGGKPSTGVVDSLLNCTEVQDAPNILTLHVTSCPYALQTQCTRISPYNEIHWPSASNLDVDMYHEKTKYFGVSEFLESMHLGNGQPLLRYDGSFESMATALGERFPRLHSAVIRTYILIRHYTLALMAVSGQTQLQKYTSAETLEIVRGLVTSARCCPSRHGHMVLIRVPSPSLASMAYQRLRQARESTGLQDLFEIVLGDPGSALSVGEPFLSQLKVWLKIQNADWSPHTYLELEALPCIVIFTGLDPQGESLPRSLKYCDLRLSSPSNLLRTDLEQELGLACYLVAAEPRNNQAAISDLSESDPEKLSSTDNEDEEVVADIPCIVKRSPVQRQRSLSHESAASSLSSKTSTVNGDPPILEQPGPPPPPPDSSTMNMHGHCPTQDHRGSEEDNSASCGMHKSGIPGTSKPPSSSSSFSSRNSEASGAGKPCSWARGRQQPPAVFLPKAVYDMVVSADAGGLPRYAHLLPHAGVEWVGPFRPQLRRVMTATEQSLYYRQWTVPRPQHMDSSNQAVGHSDGFHPRRLLLSGPPQVGKTGAYLQFLGILSRMLIRLMEVDVYDEEEINLSVQLGLAQYHQMDAAWPNIEVFRTMHFDYTVHDPKHEHISPVHSPNFTPTGKGNPRQKDEVYLRRHTTRIKLSKYAAYNTYHHCEQCHQYMGSSPRYQLYESTLHTFTFSHLLLGEEIQLYFIIPKSKEHHFSFSQPGGQLESMRLPLWSDQDPNCIKSPIFTPTTGRHEHGLFNLYHAMDGATHLHILVIKEYEMAVYKKYWPNHIMLVLPTVFNGAGIGAAHFLIKELSYHNLELERSRQVEQGSQPQDVWPFVVLAEDSCVMWNAIDLDTRSGGAAMVERNVSLKQVLQHMESSPDVTQYGLCGLRKWSSQGYGPGRSMESFTRGHLHDFMLLNVDLTQDVQYNQNRFTCDDVDFNLRVHSAGLLICRFNRFSVMKKQIISGGHHSFIIKTKVTDVPTTVPASQYVCAPDSKHSFLAAPAQLLLERYLQHSSQTLFPLAARNSSHPVLSVDCYLNLGPQVVVCYVSSRPHSINISTAELLFSGLLLYFCDTFVTASFLKKFHFLKGATLCVICPDRSTLRQTVVRLELEDEWRLRLRDEFQTANAKEDRPLFFLTGKHI
ncbi:protein GREB1 isoform X2 [Anguilla rostrata]|uniref:protein GREB1 isoform X2 n=1 Tax=Anguilla rostrata TaxID=7938 RepID=UPI0030D1DFA2